MTIAKKSSNQALMFKILLPDVRLDSAHHFIHSSHGQFMNVEVNPKLKCSAYFSLNRSSIEFYGSTLLPVIANYRIMGPCINDQSGLKSSKPDLERPGLRDTSSLMRFKVG